MAAAAAYPPGAGLTSSALPGPGLRITVSRAPAPRMATSRYSHSPPSMSNVPRGSTIVPAPVRWTTRAASRSEQDASQTPSSSSAVVVTVAVTGGAGVGRSTISQSAATSSWSSANTVSVSEPQAIVSRSPSRARITSLPEPARTSSSPLPGSIDDSRPNSCAEPRITNESSWSPSATRMCVMLVPHSAPPAGVGRQFGDDWR